MNFSKSSLIVIAIFTLLVGGCNTKKPLDFNISYVKSNKNLYVSEKPFNKTSLLINYSKRIENFDWSPSRNYVFISNNKNINLYDNKSRLIKTASGFSPTWLVNDKIIYSTKDKILLFSPKTSKKVIVGNLRLSSDLSSLGVSPKRDQVFGLFTLEGKTRFGILSQNGRFEEFKRSSRNQIYSNAWSPDGKLVSFSNNNEQIEVWNKAAKKIASLRADAREIVWENNHTVIYANYHGHDMQTLYRWDIKSKESKQLTLLNKWAGNLDLKDNLLVYELASSGESITDSLVIYDLGKNQQYFLKGQNQQPRILDKSNIIYINKSDINKPKLFLFKLKDKKSQLIDSEVSKAQIVSG